jgi:hypothetical protein
VYQVLSTINIVEWKRKFSRIICKVLDVDFKIKNSSTRSKSVSCISKNTTTFAVSAGWHGCDKEHCIFSCILRCAISPMKIVTADLVLSQVDRVFVECCLSSSSAAHIEKAKDQMGDQELKWRHRSKWKEMGTLFCRGKRGLPLVFKEQSKDQWKKLQSRCCLLVRNNSLSGRQ